MLCKELMVGDWCCDFHGFPMQITTVGDDYAYATFEGNEGDPWEYDDKEMGFDRSTICHGRQSAESSLKYVKGYKERYQELERRCEELG